MSVLPILVTPKALADRFGISVKTLRGHVKDGNIDYVNLGKGQRKKRIAFTEDQIEEFLERRRNLGRAPCLSTATKTRHATHTISG